MDTRSLIALGMLLSLVAAALFKGAVQPNDVKEIVLFLGGGIIGFTVPRRPDTKSGTPPPAVPPGVIVALLVGSMVLLVNCGTAPPPPACNSVMVQCNPADYPPLTETLPKWPFPRLLQPIKEARR